MTVRIDAHQHFWHYTPSDYGWIDASMDVLRRDFLPDDLAPELDRQELDACVAVQARQTLAETRWLLELARVHDRVRGVVGWLDLCADDLADALEVWADEPRLVGVRHVLQDEHDDAFMLRPEFRRGLRALAARNLVYDLLLFPRHLRNACTLVEELPDQAFVLDHLAKPAIAEGRLEPWSCDLAELARLPNVTCKLSGLVTEADRHDWQASDFGPYIDVALETFGPERLMFGSDWPVCTLAASYADVVGIVEGHTGKLSSDERAALFGGTAARVYGLARP